LYFDEAEITHNTITKFHLFQFAFTGNFENIGY